MNPNQMMPQLFNVFAGDKDAFGAHWCGPAGSFQYGVDTLVARYPKTNTDGKEVLVFCCAMPARFYAVRFGDWELRTGSDCAQIAAAIAEEVARGMLDISVRTDL